MKWAEGLGVRAFDHRQHFLQLVFDFLAPEPSSHSSAVTLHSPPSGNQLTSNDLGEAAPKQPSLKDARTVELQGQKIAYELLRRKRKTIGMHVSEGKLKVAAPKWVSLTQIQQALQEKGAWILKQIEHTRAKALAAKEKDVRVQHACVLPWLGSSLQVLLQADSGTLDPLLAKASLMGATHVGAKTLALLVEHAFIERQMESGAWVRCSVQEAFERESALSHLELCADTPPFGSDALLSTQTHYRLQLPLVLEAHSELTLQVLTAVLKAHAQACFEPRLDLLAARFGVNYKRFKLSAAKTRWGSASQSGLIHLNWHLVHFSPALIDYVVAHELCHLIHMDHSEQFWARLSLVMPDGLLRRQILHRKTPPRLLPLDGSTL